MSDIEIVKDPDGNCILCRMPVMDNDERVLSLTLTWRNNKVVKKVYKQWHIPCEEKRVVK